MSEGEIRVLLLGVGDEEWQALSPPFASGETRLHLRVVASLAEALPYLEAQQVDAMVCDLTSFLRLREARAASSRTTRSLPTVVLVPPGGEECAVALVEQESADFVLQADNYPLWLPALLRRSLRRQRASWAELARVIRHEINNPLTGVLGNAELILAEAEALPEKLRHRVTTIIELAVRLRDVVRRLEENLRPEGSLAPGTLPSDSSPSIPLSREVMR